MDFLFLMYLFPTLLLFYLLFRPVAYLTRSVKENINLGFLAAIIAYVNLAVFSNLYFVVLALFLLGFIRL